jgi:hypothetical protein
LARYRQLRDLKWRLQFAIPRLNIRFPSSQARITSTGTTVPFWIWLTNQLGLH